MRDTELAWAQSWMWWPWSALVHGIAPPGSSILCGDWVGGGYGVGRKHCNENSRHQLKIGVDKFLARSSLDGARTALILSAGTLHSAGRMRKILIYGRRFTTGIYCKIAPGHYIEARSACFEAVCSYPKLPDLINSLGIPSQSLLSMSMRRIWNETK